MDFLSHLMQGVHSTKKHWAKLREGRKEPAGLAEDTELSRGVKHLCRQ